MSVALLLVHGDDSLELDETVAAFARRVSDGQATEIVPERSPDEAAIDRAQVAAGSIGLFGTQLAVLRQPLRAAGRSTAAGDRLVSLVSELPDGGALALAELRSTRDANRPPALLERLADAVVTRGGSVETCVAPRRAELAAWIRRRAEVTGVQIEGRAAAALADRVGGAVLESDVERGEQTRVADGELRKLATYAGERPISAEDVQLLVADTQPASIYGITNALDRRDRAATATAVRRSIDEGQPVLRILAALQGRISDLIVARDLTARRATPQELTRRIGRGNARMAQRLAEAAGRYEGAELEEMLAGLFEADLAIKTNVMAPEPALVAWLGEFVLGTERARRTAR
jgi:DNA polymerase III delta subunit